MDSVYIERIANEKQVNRNKIAQIYTRARTCEFMNVCVFGCVWSQIGHECRNATLAFSCCLNQQQKISFEKNLS